jgi:ABC-2 type transport system permease protein
MLRDRRFVIFTLVMPVVYYVLFTGGGGSGGEVQGLPTDVAFMVAMAGFGALAGVLLAGGGAAHDRASGWLRQLRVTPVPAAGVVGGKVIAGTALALPSIVAVFVTAVIDHHVHLGAARWVGAAVVLWLGLLPFAPLGLAIGYVSTPQSAGPTLGGTLFAVTLLGGMWVPADRFPAALRVLAHILPTSHYAGLAWTVADGRVPSLTDVAVLAAWFVVLGGVAVLAYRRAVAAR